MRLRTFKISDSQALRLSNRASGNSENTADLVRKYLDSFLENPEVFVPTEPDTLRSYYLTVEQDVKLTELSKKLNLTKGTLFRIAIDKSLGTPK